MGILTHAMLATLGKKLEIPLKDRSRSVLRHGREDYRTQYTGMPPGLPSFNQTRVSELSLQPDDSLELARFWGTLQCPRMPWGRGPLIHHPQAAIPRSCCPGVIARRGRSQVMHLSLTSSGFSFEPCTWQPQVCQKLESHHLVAWSRDVRDRTHLAASLQSYLMTQPGTEVCVLHGRAILDLDGLCTQLERQIVVDEVAQTIDGPRGIVAALRTRSMVPGRPTPRQRVILWHDADVLLRARPVLFARLVEAIAGVSGELEYAGESGVFLQRCVFLGSDRLRDEAKSEGSAFREWLDEDRSGFWSMVTGLPQPPVSVCSVDTLLAETA